MEESYVEAVAEDAEVGTTIVQVRATDMDMGANAEVSYDIRKGAYEDFQIDEVTGTVVVASKLDYDRRNTYTMEIIARDHGEPPLTGTTTLTVNVINTNDKTPYFVPTTQKAEVSIPVNRNPRLLFFVDYGRCFYRHASPHSGWSRPGRQFLGSFEFCGHRTHHGLR